jgi:hypothetical protein
MSDIKTWDGPSGAIIPADAMAPKEIVSYAIRLSEKQQIQIVNAYSTGAFDMASEYIWRISLIRLKETLQALGPKFLGEMLGKDDVDEYTSIDELLTDYSTIQLSEQLGIISSTGALKLKQAQELINHYFSNDVHEELDGISAMQIGRACVQYILSVAKTSVAVEFEEIRKKLLNEDIASDDSTIKELASYPIFYLRTMLTVLLSAIKNEKGGTFDHSVNNLNAILPHVWGAISDTDKWRIGSVYRDVTTEGNVPAASAMKKALMKVKGFDFVPENLRSNTFIKAAKEVIEVHFSMNNYYNEPAAVSKLSNLGTTIPKPAIFPCLQAYMAVYLGNQYGVSFKAEGIALEQLKRISIDDWHTYFDNALASDEVILGKMLNHSPFQRMTLLISSIKILSDWEPSGITRKLIGAIKKKDFTTTSREATSLLEKFKQGR